MSIAKRMLEEQMDREAAENAAYEDDYEAQFLDALERDDAKERRTTMSIDDTEVAAAYNAKAPRVSLDDITNAIAYRHYTTGGHIVATHSGGSVPPEAKSLEVLTICLLVMRNGFTVVGKSAPAHPDNFDRDLGMKLAYEDAIRQLWPLMGFALRDRLWRDSEDAMELLEEKWTEKPQV